MDGFLAMCQLLQILHPEFIRVTVDPDPYNGWFSVYGSPNLFGVSLTVTSVVYSVKNYLDYKYPLVTFWLYF